MRHPLRNLSILLSALALAVASPAAALAYTVTSTADDGANGTLRYGVDTSSDDSIDFDAATNGSTFELTNGQLSITRNLTIKGNGQSNTVLSGVDATRIFYVNPDVTLNVSDMTLQHGGDVDGGGAIENDGTVNANKVTMQDNVATNGGAVQNNGTMTILNSTLKNNDAYCDGGAIHNTGTLNVTSSLLQDNQAGTDCQDGRGGGIAGFNEGSVTISLTSIKDNTATEDGGGVYTDLTNLSIDKSTLSGNESGGEGGGLAAYQSLVTLTNSTLSGNTADECGGGAYLGTIVNQGTVTNSTIAGNTSNFCGGGVALQPQDDVMFTNVTIASNNVQHTGLFFNPFATTTGGGVAIERFTEIGPCFFMPFLCEEDFAVSPFSLQAAVDAKDIDNNVIFLNSIVANNTVTTNNYGSVTVDANDCSELVNTQGDNIDSDGDCFDTAGVTDFHGDPGLKPLGNYGGPTQTMAITKDSLAFNNDPCAVSFDQRGMPRPQFGRCDIGAFELGTALLETLLLQGLPLDTPIGGGVAATSAGVNPLSGESLLPQSGPTVNLALFLTLGLTGLYYGRRMLAKR